MNSQTKRGFRAAAQILAFIVLCEGVGLIAGLATQSSVETWYPTLAKPFFTPPDWLFAPVWTVLYALMGIAAHLVWRRRPGVQRALVLFGVQLALNAAWSLVFFGGRSISGGLVVILLLLAALLATLVAFWRRSRWAGALLVPYVVWVGYATALNAGIWWLN